jgi:hypothetical protein
MATLSKRIWSLPNGDVLVTWRVEWKEHGHARRKPFDNFSEASVFMAKLAVDLKKRKAFARAPARVDRLVKPRAKTAQIIPFRRRR